ncbi:YrdB family protein [Rathayibacter sp. VKM Ac-2759]|uniref:YrdB family protein n=1 Tax=Rathayibacter sp. VKM Ac-2759 TaxID=2609252 RepID=UPI001FC95820|nr:YrdB family protein [Rathayibacter sp. VKM Ac-2759]
MNRAGAGAAGTEVRIGPNDVLRFVLELFALVTFGIWGFTTWALPLSIVFGIGAPVLAALVWALFLSPRAVFSLDVYGRSLIELLVMGAAAVAWLDMGQPIVAIVFGVVAVVSGVIAGRRAVS